MSQTDPIDLMIDELENNLDDSNKMATYQITLYDIDKPQNKLTVRIELKNSQAKRLGSIIRKASQKA